MQTPLPPSGLLPFIEIHFLCSSMKRKASSHAAIPKRFKIYTWGVSINLSVPFWHEIYLWVTEIIVLTAWNLRNHGYRNESSSYVKILESFLRRLETSYYLLKEKNWNKWNYYFIVISFICWLLEAIAVTDTCKNTSERRKVLGRNHARALSRNLVLIRHCFIRELRWVKFVKSFIARGVIRVVDWELSSRKEPQRILIVGSIVSRWGRPPRDSVPSDCSQIHTPTLKSLLNDLFLNF